MDGKTLVVTSGKGGVGKTTLTANSGLAIAPAGQQLHVLPDAPPGGFPGRLRALFA